MSSGPYRAGPWPGLTVRGGGVLLGCAALLAIGQALVGPARRAWPDEPLLTLVSLVPLAMAARITGVAGAASAVCGAYLLPRTLVSLLEPTLELPPLLLVPAIALDLCLWLRAADLAAVRAAWPRRAPAWRKRPRPARGVGAARAAISGATFGLVLAAIVPPWSVLLGADAATWSGPGLAPAAAACGVLGALVGLSVRGTGS